MSREPQEPPPESREVSPPTPPEELKPWYYQYWFLYPTIIFWPLWPALIIRSPWHNGLVSGAIAWAMLIAGGYLVYLRMRMGGTVALTTLMLIVPGLILTLITQMHWLFNRRRILDAATRPNPAPAPTRAAPGELGQPPGNRDSTRRRRSYRRRKNRR